MRTKRLLLMKKYLPVYILVLLPVIQVILFRYLPMAGIQIAFRDFKIKRGMWASDWIGLKNFEKMFSDHEFYTVLWNTLRLSALSLIVTFPVTIIFALLMNEVRSIRFKRIAQTITYLPHFLSWVIVGGFVTQMLSPTYGFLNAVLIKTGLIEKSVYFLVRKEMFTPIYLITSLWKELGWSIVVYLAAISSIDPGLYEASVIDGANRFQRVLYITFPCILPTVSTMLILSLGSLISVGFDPIFNLYTPGTYEVADVIATYVYRKGLVGTKFDYTTAIGLFQNVVALILVLAGNYLARLADPNYRII